MGTADETMVKMRADFVRSREVRLVAAVLVRRGTDHYHWGDRDALDWVVADATSVAAACDGKTLRSLSDAVRDAIVNTGLHEDGDDDWGCREDDVELIRDRMADLWAPMPWK